MICVAWCEAGTQTCRFCGTDMERVKDGGNHSPVTVESNSEYITVGDSGGSGEMAEVYIAECSCGWQSHSTSPDCMEIEAEQHRCGVTGTGGDMNCSFGSS